MKNIYLLLIVFLITSCDKDENEREYNTITVEKHYPYLHQKEKLNDVEKNKIELFNQKAYLINSIGQLETNPLFIYCSETLKDEFYNCDFDKYTLIISSSSSFSEVTDLRVDFKFRVYSSEYVYNQTLYCKPVEKPIQNVFFVLNAFLVKKIPNDANLHFTIGVL